ncbi:pyridoxal phosphate-dependent transferase [Aspergillus ambiguus]|uniref:pyridoxal phosphate-dependent decarboxylase family protein n=1 Tax=Aspergillus ambiguus TaxID=176160 RepID=UPI003CCDEC68
MELNDIDAASVTHGQLQKELWRTAQSPWKSGILPSAESLARARASLPAHLSQEGIGFEASKNHVLTDIVPAFNGSSICPNYYGFITGGVTPAALFADNVVSTYDQNVQVHLPEHSISTDVESCALGLLVDLLDLERGNWHHGTFTTGATASNILGLACGREYAIRLAGMKNGHSALSVGDLGLFEAMQAAGISGVQVLSTLPHSSLAKAAGVLGIGRSNVKNVCQEENPLKFDLARLESELQKSDKATIVAVSCGEVNTGHFATSRKEDMQALRQLCDKYGAWIHVDGAFGIFGRVLENSAEFASIRKSCDGIELADSITGDGHKLLNVPYDCGFFLCRHGDEANNVFQNANAAYLTAGNSAQPSIPSPLNIGIENSRRFRALPVYTTLVAYGKTGYRGVLERQIRLARMVAAWLFDHPAYNVLPESLSKEQLSEQTYMSVLFSAKEDELNKYLAKNINDTAKMFVSGTSWQGRSACRIAISNWRVNEVRDFAIITAVLDAIAGNAQN